MNAGTSLFAPSARVFQSDWAYVTRVNFNRDAASPSAVPKVNGYVPGPGGDVEDAQGSARPFTCQGLDRPPKDARTAAPAVQPLQPGKRLDPALLAETRIVQ